MSISALLLAPYTNRRSWLRRFVAAWFALSVLGTGVVFALDSHTETLHGHSTSTALTVNHTSDEPAASSLADTLSAQASSNSAPFGEQPGVQQGDQHGHSCHSSAHMLAMIYTPDLQLPLSNLADLHSRWSGSYASYFSNPALRPPRRI